MKLLITAKVNGGGCGLNVDLDKISGRNVARMVHCWLEQQLKTDAYGFEFEIKATEVEKENKSHGI